MPKTLSKSNASWNHLVSISKPKAVSSTVRKAMKEAAASSAKKIEMNNKIYAASIQDAAKYVLK